MTAIAELMEKSSEGMLKVDPFEHEGNRLCRIAVLGDNGIEAEIVIDHESTRQVARQLVEIGMWQFEGANP